MQLEITRENNDATLRFVFDSLSNSFRDAADEAAKTTTELVKQRAKEVVSTALGANAYDTITSKLYVSVTGRGTGSARGLVFSRWWRRKNGGLQNTGKVLGSGNDDNILGGDDPLNASDVLAKHETGGAILPSAAGRKMLFLPFPGFRTRRGKLPYSKDSKRIQLVPLGPGRGYLVIDYYGLISRPRKTKKNPRPRAIITGKGVPIGVLKPIVYLGQRLNMEPVRDYAVHELGEQFLVSLAKRGIDLE